MKNIFLLLKNINNYGFGVFLNIIFFELKYFFSNNNINTLHHDSEFTSNYNDTKAKKILKSVYNSLKKHKTQINNDTSFHDWTINPNSEKLIIRSVKTHEQFLKEFGINTNEKKRRNK